MRALTLTQPWATLVAIGAKQMEARSWNTSYRGPLAIHAAKRFPVEAVQMCYLYPFAEVLAAADQDISRLPLGKVVAVCELVDVVRFNGTGQQQLQPYLPLAPHDLAFGDYSVGRYGFILRDVRRLDVPVPTRGYQMMWQWEAAEGLGV